MTLKIAISLIISFIAGMIASDLLNKALYNSMSELIEKQREYINLQREMINRLK